MPTILKEVTVDLLEDRPGMLARAAEVIAAGGLSIEGFAEVEGTFHVLTSDADSARLALDAAGLRVSGERDVVVTPVEDLKGAAAAVFGRLAKANVNVDYAYLASGSRFVIGTAEPRRALEVLVE
jgi:hypothetical protein